MYLGSKKIANLITSLSIGECSEPTLEFKGSARYVQKEHPTFGPSEEIWTSFDWSSVATASPNFPASCSTFSLAKIKK